MRAFLLFAAVFMTAMFALSAVMSTRTMFAAADAGHPDEWAFYRTLLYLTLASITVTLAIVRAKRL